MSRIRFSAFRWVPPFAQGLVRDLRVRWALGEAGLDHEEHLVGFDDRDTPAYRRWQPFGQVPAFEEDGLTLFESGAIVLHIAERSAALMPGEAEAQARASVRTWMFAALNTVEPPITMLNRIDLQDAADAAGAAPLRESVVEAVRTRLTTLAAVLDGRDHLVGDRFSAADLLMTTVLRALRNTDLVTSMPVLDAYRLRCEARPAFGKALADQMATYAANAPADDAA